LLVAIAVASFGVIVLAYLLAPRDRWTRAYLADLSWTWASAYALVCAAIAARRHPDREQRRAWAWIGAGCLLFLGGQLVWNEAELVRRVTPPYPSLADVGFLGVYVCFLVAVVTLGRAQPRRLDLELVLDGMLVTLTLGALAYTFLLQPLFAAGGTRAALITSAAWSIGGVAVLWLILVELVRATAIPLVTTGGVIASVSVLCVSNVIYAGGALRGSFHSGGALDLGWDAGFLLLAATAALAPSRSAAAADGLATISGHAARVTAVVIGLAGIAAVGAAAALKPVSDPAGAVLIGSGLAIIGARIVYSLRADRRYTALLENEVAGQTRTLMESLGATAAAERNLRLVMDAVPDAIVLADAAGRIVESNEPARAIGAVPGADSRTVFAAVTPEAAALVRETLAAAFRGEVQRLEIPLVRADSSQGVGALLCAPVREGGRITRMLVLVRDITEQKRSESQYQQAEKLAAMGHLVSGVAHEINNPAAIISGFAQTLLLDDLKPEHREMLQMMYDEATRIGRITANLLAFARAGGAQRALVDVNDLARRTFALRSYHLRTLTITVSLDLDPSEPQIWANGSELQQMVLNLLINAEQALVTVEPPRTITVRTRADEREARLEIADSGPGIAPEIRAKVFDPFFTTKAEGVGTGLGLSICYGIAREHGGRIWVESEPGSGARFCVLLPRDQRVEARPAPPTAPPASATGRLAVLVVDDETALRNALLRFLNRRGIQGEGVADGAEALRVLQQRDFDVIISDVRMLGMSGREFLERLRRERGDLVGRVVFSTGDTFAPDTAALLQESGLPTITKPLDFAALEHVIRQVAGRAAGRVA
jgi:two-component system NtrC family sensor kinase